MVRRGNVMVGWGRWGLLAAGLMLVSTPTLAGEGAIVAKLKQYFDAPESANPKLVREIAQDPAFDFKKLSGWLHAADLWQPLPAGQTTITVPLRRDETRRVVLRIPEGYEPGKPMPLIYALHGTGGNAEQIIAYVEQILPEDLREAYIIAAPDQYEDVVLHERWPLLEEHPMILTAIRRKVHIDSNRVYALGYSRGGHAAWTLAVLHPEEFAACIPLAGTLLMPDVDLLWPEFLPAVAQTHVFCVYGADDTVGDAGAASPQGGIAGMNRLLAEQCRKEKLAVKFVELAGVGHGGVRPSEELVRKALTCKRDPYPKQVCKAFRHLAQTDTWWIEGHEWRGEEWTDAPLQVALPANAANNDAARRKALLNAYRQRLGELSGKIDGQTVDVRRKRIGVLTVWFGPESVDFAQPVTAKVSGKKRFEGVLEPDLQVCLQQAARNWDFDRLHVAGLRFNPPARMQVVNPRTPMPDPFGG